MLIKDLDKTLPVTGITEFKQAAWIAYWQWVSKVIKQSDCDFATARKKVHAKGIMPQFDIEPAETGSFWQVQDCVAEFMKQFPVWQQKEYNQDEIWEARQTDAPDVQLDIPTLLERGAGVQLLLHAMSYEERDRISYALVYAKAIDELKQLCDDPLYGVDAQLELRIYERSEKFRQDEKIRRAALPENVKQVDQILAWANPSNYVALYPYIAPQFHSVPDCLCVMADGSPIFRLQVLDPDKVTQFRLAGLMKPWWNDQYDFDFKKYNINVGDTFNLKTLLNVLTDSIICINKRYKEKYHVSNFQ